MPRLRHAKLFSSDNAVNKTQLKDSLLQTIDEAIEAGLEAARVAQESAAHEDNQPENQYDTLSLEAAYLAHGQSERILALQNDRIVIARWSPATFTKDSDVASGALVGLADQAGNKQWLWLALIGGWKLNLEGKTVQVISAEAPLARQLTGLGLDDEISIAGTEWRVIEIS